MEEEITKKQTNKHFPQQYDVRHIQRHVISDGLFGSWLRMFTDIIIPACLKIKSMSSNPNIIF